MSNAKAAREPSCRVMPDHFPGIGKMIWFSFDSQHEGLPRQKKRHYKIPINWNAGKRVMNKYFYFSCACVAMRFEELGYGS